jgi:hypothetical protein
MTRTRKQLPAQPAINVVEYARLRCGDRMDAVRLEHAAVVGKSLQQERNQRHVLLSGYFGEQAFEPPRVHPAVVGRNAHAGNDDSRSGLAPRLDDGNEVGADFLERAAAQAVISAQSDDEHGGPVFVKRRSDTVAPAERRFPADAGVDYVIVELVALQALLQ